MALTKLQKDLQHISKLSDTPNSSDDLNSTELKARFDQAGVDIKSYINDTLTEEIDSKLATKEELAEVILGQVANNSVSEEKLTTDLQAKINNAYDVDNNITKALLYPHLLSKETLDAVKSEANYSKSQINGMLSELEYLMKAYTALKYDTVISGNSTSGVVQETNITYSSLPTKTATTGTGSASVDGNDITLTVGSSATITADFHFDNGGCDIEDIMMQCNTNVEGGNYTCTGIFKCWYSTDNATTWKDVNSSVTYGHCYSGTATGCEINLINSTITMRDPYYYPSLVWFSLGNTSGEKITDLRFYLTNNTSRTGNLHIYPRYACTSSKLDDALKIESRTGMWQGGTGSMSVTDSGLLTLSEKLPTNSSILLCIETREHYERSTSISNLKKMYLRGSNDGIEWKDLITITSAKRYGQYAKFYSIPGGYKYYKFETPSQSTSSYPATTILLRGIILTKNDSITYITSKGENELAVTTKAYYTKEDDGNAKWTVSAIVDPDGLAEKTVLTGESAEMTTVTNTGNSREIAFELTTNNLIGSTKITTFLGGYI